MAGILSYGAYIPMWRISRDEIAKGSGRASMGGERAVASWDEDSLTMAVEAGLDCLSGIDPKEIDGIYFATVSSPYKEKQAASIIASALDLRKDAYTFDFTDSLRAGTSAIKAALDAVKAGTARNILVIAADSRTAMPRSEFVQLFGDAAAAFLIGENGTIAEIEGFSSISDAIVGPWKREEDLYLRVFEAKLDRLYGFLKDVPGAVAELMKKCGIEAKDISKFAIYGPDPRSYMDFARSLKIDPKTQLQDPLFATVGVTGVPHCLLLLVSALEAAKPDERIICASYGEGSDAFLVRTTDKVEQEKGKHRGTKYVSSKRMLPSYAQFSDFKKERETGWPDWAKSALVKYWRDEKWELPLYGMRCNKCGILQYPIGRCCAMCGERDNHEDVRLARKGEVFAYTHDYLVGPGNLPADGISATTRAVVDLEDGCRLFLEMCDREMEEVDIGMPVELTFRLFNQKSNYRYYAWRARPVRQ